MAVSVTVSSSAVTVTSGTGTLDDVYVAVNDSLVMAKSGANPYVYTIKGNRSLTLNSGVTINISNAGDVLEWDITATVVVLRVNSGSTLTMTSNCVLRGDSNATSFASFYIYGSTTFTGTSGNEVILEDYAWLYLWDAGTSSLQTWDYVILRNNTNSTGTYLLSGTGYASVRANNSFTNMTISSTNGKGFGIIWSGDCSSYTLDNITMDGLSQHMICYGMSCKFSNSTFKNSVKTPIQLFSVNGSGHLESTKNLNPNKELMHQPKVTFDNCTFQNNYTSISSERCFYIPYGAYVKFKNCSFLGANSSDPSTYGTMSYRRSKLLYEGTTTFTDVSVTKFWSGDGSHFHVWPLTMTVQDEKGNAIQNALVIVRHIDGNEAWMFHTNASGQVLDLFGDDPVFVEKEETSIGVYTSWTSPGHEIVVSKPGFQVWRQAIVFNAAQTVTAELAPESSPRPLPVDFGG